MTPSAPTNICTRWGWRFPDTTLSNGIKCAALFLIAIYIWFLPIGNTIAVRHLAFFSLILLTAWSAWQYKLKLQLPLKKTWLAYTAVALLSLTYAINPDYSLGEIQQEIGYCILAMSIGATWINNSRAFGSLIAIVILGMLLMVGYALINGLIVTPFWLEGLAGLRSINNGVGTFSTFLITTIPFLTAFILLKPMRQFTLRLALIMLLIGSIAALYLTGNRMGILSLGIELLVASAIIFFSSHGKINSKLLITLFLFICIVAGSFVALLKNRPASDDERIHIWKVVVKNIQAQPFSGGGFGIEAFKMRNPDYIRIKPVSWHAHNMVLNKGVQIGIPGMIVFLALFYATLHAVWPTRDMLSRTKPMWVYSVAGTAMVVGMFVKNMTDDFFTNDPALLFWLLIGALIGAIRHESQNATLNITPDFQN